jgi:hypothetical protein
VNAPIAMRRHGELARIQARALRAHRRRHAMEAHGPTRVSLWLPLTPFFWLLAPFVFLLAPLLLLAPPMWRVNPYLAVFTIGRVLTSLGGTEVDVDAHDVRIRLRIF